MFRAALLLSVSVIGTQAFGNQMSGCREPYDDLNEAINALQQQKFLLALKFATATELLEEEDRFLSCYREMVQNKTDINYSDSTGATPALLAAYFRLYRVLEFLEENGADIDIKDQSGYSARSIRELKKSLI